jgi:hypothetical protein
MQAAARLGISLSTANWAWRYARAWLYAATAGAGPEEKSIPPDVFRVPASHDGGARMPGHRRGGGEQA